jgi:hypothetical protein
MLQDAHEVLRKVAGYTKPASMVQRVCDHPAQIIALQAEITKLKIQAFLLPRCDHTEIVNRIQSLTNKREEDRRIPTATRTDEELYEELAVMTWDAQKSGKEVCGVRMQRANTLTLAARAALVAPSASEDSGQRYPDSLDSSKSNQTKLRGWIA